MRRLREIVDFSKYTCSWEESQPNLFIRCPIPMGDSRRSKHAGLFDFLTKIAYTLTLRTIRSADTWASRSPGVPVPHAHRTAGSSFLERESQWPSGQGVPPHVTKRSSPISRSVGEIPRHIAVIMDGNGRWAQRRGLPRIAGHRKASNPSGISSRPADNWASIT